jgi:hypothetical protein
MSNEFYPHKSFTNYRIQANNLDIMRQRIYANISDLNKYKHQLNAKRLWTINESSLLHSNYT